MMLRFDFFGNTLRFAHPIKIIKTDCLDEVVTKLAEVEQQVALGFYAAGYLAYEAAAAFQPYYQTPPQGEMPLLWFAIYSHPEQDDTQSTITPQFTPIKWLADTLYPQYHSAIKQIREQIEEGNTYQVNYTIRLNSEFHADPYAFYCYLQQAQQARYSAYLDIGDFQLLSASPELFFHYKDNKITTKPMKGTSPRGKWGEDDLIEKNNLFSEKNLAENRMIVDLLRNDLNKIAQPGTVKVTQLFDAEKYPTVWQLTSTIEADVDQSIRLLDIFKALFPCGSITGAPKVSTMKIIAQLEPNAREVYCGAIGYITPNKEALFSVPIRTVIVNANNATAQYGVGGGITWDSTSEDEYQEIVNKAKILHGVKQPDELLESLLLDNGTYFLLDEHLQRLASSAAYFTFICPIEHVRAQLYTLAYDHPAGKWKVRLTVSREGRIKCEALSLKAVPVVLQASWSPNAVDSHNRLLYHKTTERRHYPCIKHGQEYLLYNELGEVTEFVNGNVVLLLNNRYVTPALTSGLLPGTMRAHLIKQGKLHEATIYKNEVAQAEKLFFINSVRGWREVQWVNTSLIM